MGFIDPRKSYTYFTSNYQLRQSTNGWYLFNCPLCGGHFTRGVQFLYGITKCFKPCSYTGDIIGYVAFIEDTEYEDAKKMLWRVEPSKINFESLADIEYDNPKHVVSEVVLPDGYTSLLSGTGALAKRARRYLTKRGFNITELDREGFGYCDQDHEDYDKDFYGYIIVPFKRAGRLVYYLGRSFIGHEEMRYKNPPKDWVGIGKSDVIFNEEALLLYNEVFTLEGWSDAKTLGPKATARLGWSMSTTQKGLYLRSKCKRLVWVSDVGKDDGADLTFYQKDVQTAMEFLDSGKEIYVVNPNVPHLMERGKDVNEIGRELIMEEYRNNTERLTWGKAMEVLTAKTNH